MMLPLVADVWQELLVRGEGLIVLLVVGQSQDPIQALQQLASLGVADPLPPRMDPLCVQYMVRRQEKARSQEPKQVLIPPIVVPQKGWRVHCGKRCQVLPEVSIADQSLFEVGPMAWLCCR